jgi:hypothetical protein
VVEGWLVLGDEARGVQDPLLDRSALGGVVLEDVEGVDDFRGGAGSVCELFELAGLGFGPERGRLVAADVVPGRGNPRSRARRAARRRT